MSDRLRLDYINSLPQPLLVRVVGYKNTWWELHDIDVETGCLRFDVCGLLQVSHIGEIGAFRDMDGVEHDPETFYSDYEDPESTAQTPAQAGRKDE